MVNLQKIVIHEIRKEIGTKEADIKFSNRCLDSSEERRIRLVSKLAESFRGRQNVGYSGLDRNERFPELLDKYLEKLTVDDDLTEEDFWGFSRSATSLLYESIKESTPARGGYLVFSEYNHQQHHYISIFLVRDTQGEIFKISGDVVDVENIVITDTNKLAMACRINVGKFLRDEKTPMMMINKRTHEVSEYFAKWLGSKDKETSENFTEKLVGIIRNIKPPEPEEGGKELTPDDIGKRVYEIVASDHEGNARLDVIGKVAFNNEDVIFDYLEKHHIEIPSDFKIHPQTLKKLVEVRVKNDGMLLQFSRNDFQRKVIFGENDTVIIKSRSIYKELREQFGEDE